MEGLNFERRKKDSSKENIMPMTEVPILAKEDKEDAMVKIREEKIRKGKTDPHWQLINPDKLEDVDIYSFYRTFIDNLGPWESEESEDFKNYAEKVNKYLETEYGLGNQTARLEDSRNNLYALIRSYLMEKGARKKKIEKNKAETIH